VLAILGSGPASGPAVALMNTSGETRGFGSRVEVPGIEEGQGVHGPEASTASRAHCPSRTGAVEYYRRARR